MRFLALVTADLGAFWVLRELVRSVRDHAVLGGWVAGVVRDALPGGHLNGFKYAAALFIGLLVTGNYGAGDRRGDAARLFHRGCEDGLDEGCEERSVALAQMLVKR